MTQLPDGGVVSGGSQQGSLNGSRRLSDSRKQFSIGVSPVVRDVPFLPHPEHVTDAERLNDADSTRSSSLCGGGGIASLTGRGKSPTEYQQCHGIRGGGGGPGGINRRPRPTMVSLMADASSPPTSPHSNAASPRSTAAAAAAAASVYNHTIRRITLCESSSETLMCFDVRSTASHQNRITTTKEVRISEQGCNDNGTQYPYGDFLRTSHASP